MYTLFLYVLTVSILNVSLSDRHSREAKYPRFTYPPSLVSFFNLVFLLQSNGTRERKRACFFVRLSDPGLVHLSRVSFFCVSALEYFVASRSHYPSAVAAGDLIFSLGEPHHGPSWKRSSLDITTCRTSNTKILQIGPSRFYRGDKGDSGRMSCISARRTRDERATWAFLNGPHYPDKPSYRPRKRHRVIPVNFVMKMGRWNASRYGELIGVVYRVFSL